jgi:hypothetical protein
MIYKSLDIVAAAAIAVLLSAPAGGQTNPKLHVNPRWKQCSIQLDPSLTQSAWRQFTREAAQVVYFRPLADAREMGRGKFELSVMQWQTNVDDNSSAWNDTFVHPDSTHWLYEGSGLQFPGLAARAGVGSSTDVGLYFTKNFQANYGAYGLQLQQSLLREASDWDVSARASFVSLFGPEDVDLSVYGVDVVANWKHWRFGPAPVTPYAGVATYLASSHEKSKLVNLADERVIGAIGTVGAAVQVSAVRIGAEASMSRLPSFALKLGVGR